MAYKLDNVLLVDDDAITNFINMDIIKEMGIARKINLAGDGHEALEFIKANWLKEKTSGERDTNLIFLDINMPQMGAFQFLERFELLQTDHIISVVLLTTSNNIRDVERAKHFNVSSYIAKPLDRQKVYTALQLC